VGEWKEKSGKESRCHSKTCGRGGGHLKRKQTRTKKWDEYTIKTNAQHGGKACAYRSGATRNESTGSWTPASNVGCGQWYGSPRC
jgi:hypothetical protein